jgi:hypothetical protein
MDHNRREILRSGTEVVFIYKQMTRSVVCCHVEGKRLTFLLHYFYPENRLHTQCGWKKNVKIPTQIEYFSFILLKTNTAYNQNM